MLLHFWHVNISTIYKKSSQTLFLSTSKSQLRKESWFLTSPVSSCGFAASVPSRPALHLIHLIMFPRLNLADASNY